MDSKELLKYFNKIEKEVISKPPTIWIRFSVFKKNVNDIPDDAETTAKKVILYFNIATGGVYFHNNNEPYIKLDDWISEYSCAKYSKKYDCVIISSWQAEATKNITNRIFTGKEPFFIEKNKVESNYTILIANDKSIIGYDLIPDYKAKKYKKINPLRKGSLKEFNYGLHSIFNNRCINLEKSFQEMFKIGLLGGNEYTTFNNVEHITRFLSYKEPELRNTPKQKLVNDLIKTELKVPKITFGNDKLICVASKVNTEYSALRWFMKLPDKSSYEISRLYVNKNSHIFCRKNSVGQYIVLNNKLASNAFESQKIIIQDKDAFTGTKLEYFTSIYEELSPSCRSSTLYMLTIYPEFEKMYKSGFKKVCLQYLSQISKQSWTNFLNTLYGRINTKEKSLTKMFGFNKHQLELLNSRIDKKYNYYYPSIGRAIKEILNTSDCNDIDNTSFDALFELLDYTYNTFGHDYTLIIALSETVRTYSLKVCINMLPKIKEIIGVSKRVNVTSEYGTYERTMPALSLYFDYVRIVRLMNTSRYMRPNFDTYEDILRMHDDAMTAYNMQKSSIESAKFTKRIDIWKKWEYDENEKYIVISPLKPEDLANEGIKLHHCVKSYIQRVADGATNIMFIREKSNIEEPFFTVEIGNKGTIEQIHGFANRNANTEPDLVEFIEEWTKNKKLKNTNYNKIR